MKKDGRLIQNNRFTEEWFIQRGYTKNANGGYDPPKFKSKTFAPETVISDSVSINKPEESVLKIDGLVAGLNGDKGLMRSHWSSTKKQKDLYGMIIKDHINQGKVRKHDGKVSIQYIGYKSVLMDWDNFCSSFKHIGDALVKAEIITDDKPSVVIEFIPQQVKCKRIEQKVLVIIKDYY